MYENLCGIRLSGEMLENETNFDLFELTNSHKFPTRMSIVYGKNGSGKSTLTRGFEKYKGNAIDSLSTYELYDFEKLKIEESDNLKGNIFIFNESFIEKNVKIKGAGLDAIVMFGEQANLEEEITKLEKELIIKKSELEKQQIICQEFFDNSNVKSPTHHWNNMLPLIKGDTNWAGIEKRIKGHTKNASVNNDTISAIIASNPVKDETDISKELDDKLKLLSQISGEGAKIENTTPQIDIVVDIEKIDGLLSKKIENSQLSDRDKKIMEMVLAGNQKRFMEVKEIFASDDVLECPYCLQSINQEYKKDLIDSIEKVLNKDVDIHTQELESVKLSPLYLDFSALEALEQNKLSEVKKNYGKLNDAITQYNKLIDKKINNIYTPIIDVDINYSTIEQQLKDSLLVVEELRIAYNKKFNEEHQIKDDALLLNKQLANYKIKSTYNDYLNQVKNSNDAHDKLASITTMIKSLESQLDKLKQKQKNVDIAVEFINDGLKYIFFSSTRMEIKANQNCYALFSNNKSVKPSDISCGERNILALCYFFTLMMGNLNKRDVYTKESLLIIDDPVSSFDLDHKVGILSYLKSQLLKVMRGNLNSKAIIFSHDLSTVYDMMKQFEEIKDAIKEEYNEAAKEVTTNFSKWELKHFTLQAFPFRKRNEYSILLQTIYNYANGTDNDSDLVIGNIMRRALESFSTFEYKKGIDTISCNRQILDSMGDEKYSQYFENLMYRLVLNGESHMENHIKSLEDLNFYHTIESSEKRRTAKDILCLINILNQSHLAAHVSDIKDAATTIQSWCNDILNQ